MLLPFLILVRIVSNPLSNLFQKKLVSESASPLFIIFITYGLLSIAALPLVVPIISAKPPFEFFMYMILCGIFTVWGNTLLVKALGYGDLSLLGPINSYKPIVGMIGGIFLLQEIPGTVGLLGVLFIIAGSYFIADNTGIKSTSHKVKYFLTDKGIQLRFAALLLSGTEAVFMKKAMTYSSPLFSMAMWCYMGFIISGLVVLLVYRKQLADEYKVVSKMKLNYVFLFITTGLMQYSTFLIFDRMQVSYALALFQTSILLSVFFGYKFFNEKNIKKRLIGSFFMIAGSVIIIIFGK